MEIVVGIAGYAVAMLAATFWVGRIHRRAGPAFAARLFARRPELGEAANRLVVIGMMLFALGAGCFLVRGLPETATLARAVELAADRSGAFFLILALIHFVRFWNLIHIGSKKKKRPPQEPLWKQKLAAIDFSKASGLI